MTDWVFQVLTAVAGAAGVYAAIRSDLARLHERATQALHTAERAHSRIDSFHNTSRG